MSAPPRPWSAALALTGTAVLTLTTLSWVRRALTGHLAPDLGPLPTPQAAVAMAVLVATVVASFVAWRRLVDAAGSVPLRFALAGALGITVLAAPMLPMLSNDLFSVLAYADLAWSSDVDPLTLPWPGLGASRFHDLVSPAWRWAPSVYGPAQLVIWAPALSGQALGAVLIAKAVAAALQLALLGFVALHARTLPASRQGAAFALAAFSPVLWIEGAGQAHGDLSAALFVALWLVLAARGEVVPAGIAAGLAVASKLTALVVAGMYVVHLLARRRFAAAGAASAAIAVTVTIAWAPLWSGPLTLRRPLMALGWRFPTHTLHEVVFQLLQYSGTAWRPALDLANSTGTALTALVAVAGVVGAARSATIGELAARALAVLALSVTLTAPVFHAWYLLPCVPLATELRDRSWQRWWIGASGLLSVLGGSCLIGWGAPLHEVYRIFTVTLACLLALWLLPARLRMLVGGTSLAPSSTEITDGGDMAKPTTKPSDRGRDNPEPGPPPGSRAEQRGTVAQLDREGSAGDDAVEWERSEQEKLPPRGEGNQKNQGDDRGPTVAEVGDEVEPVPALSGELHTGGTRGPSNQHRSGDGTPGSSRRPK